MAARLIAGGAFTRLIINGKQVGLVSNASYDEDFGVVPAKVLNHLGPIDYDSQDYNCRLTLGTFIPEPGQNGPWPDGGTIALSSLLPTRASVQQNAGRPGMFDVVQFMSTSSNQVLNQFEQVMVASDGVQVGSNAYITANLQLMAIERTI